MPRFWARCEPCVCTRCTGPPGMSEERVLAPTGISRPPSIPHFPCRGGFDPPPQGTMWVGEPRLSRLLARRPGSRDRGRGAVLRQSPVPWGGAEGARGGHGGGDGEPRSPYLLPRLCGSVHPKWRPRHIRFRRARSSDAQAVGWERFPGNRSWPAAAPG